MTLWLLQALHGGEVGKRLHRLFTDVGYAVTTIATQEAQLDQPAGSSRTRTR